MKSDDLDKRILLRGILYSRKKAKGEILTGYHGWLLRYSLLLLIHEYI